MKMRKKGRKKGKKREIDLRTTITYIIFVGLLDFFFSYIRGLFNKEGEFKKKKRSNFSHKCKLYTLWNLFIAKIISISYFETIQIGIKSEYSKLEQKSVVKSLMAEMCKLYGRIVMCTENHVLSQKIFTNGQE